MPAVAAVAQHNVIWFVTIRRLAAPNREEADQQTFVGDCVEVVELGLDLETLARWIKLVHIRPPERLAHLPPSRRKNIRAFDIGTPPRKTVPFVHGISDFVNVTDTVNPDLTKRVP